jgi:transposase
MLVEPGRTIVDVATELDIQLGTLRYWLRKADAERRDDMTSDERLELRRLRNEVLELRAENTVLLAQLTILRKQRRS